MCQNYKAALISDLKNCSTCFYTQGIDCPQWTKEDEERDLMEIAEVLGEDFKR